MPTAINSALNTIKKNSLVRARELVLQGIAGGTLQALLNSGELVRVARGVYASAKRQGSGHDTLACMALQNPRLVFCLLTALQWHGLTTQAPYQVWAAVAPGQRVPKSDATALHVVRSAHLELGVQMHALKDAGQISIRVTNPARTVVDCFKFRNQIGLDVALEALADAWRQKKFTMDEIWSIAQVCRMTNVMRPYLESLV
jgi:predicted transcriptional regulator of viral defense system